MKHLLRPRSDPESFIVGVLNDTQNDDLVPQHYQRVHVGNSNKFA